MTIDFRIVRALATAGLAGLAATASAQDPPDWTMATDPFRIVGTIHYVGTKGLAAYLIKTPAGAILIDAPMAENVVAIERNIAAVGVRLRDVKVILLTHAHFDHAGGLRAMKRATGAKLIAGAGDRGALESGTPIDENLSGGVDFPAVAVDRTVRNGSRVGLGGITLTARSTPGHTAGCTSWTMQAVEQGRRLNVVFPCSITVAGNRIVGNRRNPRIVADYRASFATLAATRADVVLPAHPEGADVLGRQERRRAGDAQAFVDPALLGRIVAQARAAFDVELARQSTTGGRR